MTVRQTNKQRRRQRILDAARAIILDGGYESLTTRGLAEMAEVTVPTIYNLIGSKDDVIEALMVDGTDKVWSQWAIPEGRATLETVDDWLRACHDVIGTEAESIRAMVVASDHIAGAYSWQDGQRKAIDGAAAAVALATHLCERLQDSGVLFGRLRPESLGQQMFVCFRDPLRDWGHGTISLDEFARRFARGTYMVLCSDATDTARRKLIKKIMQLENGGSVTRPSKEKSL